MDCSSAYEPFAQKAVMDNVMPYCNTARFCPTQVVLESNIQTFMASVSSLATYHPIPAGTTYTFRDHANGMITEFQDGFAVRDNIFLGNLVVASYRAAKGALASEWQFHSSDHLGSVRFTLFPATGATDSRKYWPYGDQVGTALLPTQRLTFGAMERDVESSHFYDHARHHDFNLVKIWQLLMFWAAGCAIPKAGTDMPMPRGNPVKLLDPNGLDSTVSAVFTNSGLNERQQVAILHEAGSVFTRAGVKNVNIFLNGVRVFSSPFDAKAHELRRDVRRTLDMKGNYPEVDKAGRRGFTPLMGTISKVSLTGAPLRARVRISTQLTLVRTS